MASLDPPLVSSAMLAFASLKYEPGLPLTHAMYSSMSANMLLLEAKDLATTAQVGGGGWAGAARARHHGAGAPPATHTMARGVAGGCPLPC